MTLKEAIEQSNTEPKAIRMNGGDEYRSSYVVSIHDAAYGDWQPVMRPAITPQAGDVWDGGNGNIVFTHSMGYLDSLFIVWKDGHIERIHKDMIHGQNGWKLIFRDGKPWVNTNEY